MGGLNPDTNIGSHDSTCNSGQASCQDRVELRLGESCKEWSDHQRRFSLEKYSKDNADEKVADRVDVIQGVGIAFGASHNSFQ